MNHTHAVLSTLFDFDRALELHTTGITGVNEKESDEIDNDPLGLNTPEPWFGDDSDDK